MGRSRAEEREPLGKVVLYSTVSVDGFIADENDQPGPLFDWMSSGDVPLDETGQAKVSQASYEYTRSYWDQIGATVVGRHVFDLTNGWGGTPPGGIDHVVVVSHRPAPEGWNPEAPFHFADGVEAAMAKAQELAGDRTVEVAAGDVGGQMLAAGLVDEVAMDVEGGGVAGFWGRNGAGKSTTLKMLAGLVRPSRGTATIDGRAY